MAIMAYKPDTEPKVKLNLPTIEPNVYDSTLVDTTKTPLYSLIAYIEGAPWSVTYYSQLISKHNDLKELDSTQMELYQQYTKINNLEIRVSDGLTDSYDPQYATSSVSGSAIIYPFLVPNVGDVFTAITPSNHEAIFRVNEVERKSFNKEAVFSITYDLLCYTDDERFASLQSKVVREYYYYKDRLIKGLLPLVITKDNDAILALTNMVPTVIQYYIDTFYEPEFSTFLLPGQDVRIYDPYVPVFLSKILDTRDHLLVKNIRILNTSKDRFINQKQFYDFLLARSFIEMCNYKMGLVSTSTFPIDSVLGSIRYSRIDYITYPALPDTSPYSPSLFYKEADMSIILRDKSVITDLSLLIQDQYIDNNASYLHIKPILYDDYYVLSEDFYHHKSTLSLLEMLVNDYIYHRPICPNKLLSLLHMYTRWGRLEQYYYIPILLILLKAVIYRVY